MDTIIEVQNLEVIYKEKDIFKRLKNGKKKFGIRDINFQVKRGEIFSIIGLNGAGKTSTMKCILGLIKPDKGRVKIFGKDRLETRDFERIGYLPEISYYPKNMRLIDLMRYYCELYNIPKKKQDKKIEGILSELKIYHRKKDRLEAFSKGMLQKVGLAQAVINDPEILFLDEPMSGLDPLARQNVIEMIKRLRDNGTTVFFNTHILSDVANIGDKIAIIHDGNLKEIIDMDEVRDRSEYFIKIGKQHEEAIEEDGEYFVRVPKEKLNQRLEELIMQGVDIRGIEKNEFSLKEHFVKSIGEGGANFE